MTDDKYMNLTVTNRSGEREPYDVNRIKEVIQWATTGLDKVNPLELESKFHQRITDGIETDTIQNHLVQCAIELCDKYYPDWRYVAGRLKMWSRWRNCKAIYNVTYDDPQSILTYIQNKLALNKYTNSLYRYGAKGLTEAIKWIDPSADLDYDYAGVELLEKRYLYGDELPQVNFLVNALILALPEPEAERLVFAKRIYQYLAERKISLATPMLANLRIPKGSVTSCFITAMDDNLESIFDEIKNIARISKNGGGVGINVSNIRAANSEVMGRPNASGGVVPWIKIINDTAIAVNQGGRRAGAATVALDSWHLDVEEFLELQTENGDQRRKAYDIFPQLVVTDEFMRRVERRGDWYLVCPYQVKQQYGISIAELWGTAFENFYSRLEADIINGNYQGNYKKVDANALFKQAMKSQTETGLPYITFKCTINEANPNKHDGHIPNTNLCVAPETKILTKQGYQTIAALEGQDVEVWNGIEWSPTTVIKTGTDQELIKVNLSNGESIECTPYHKFYVQQGCQRDGKVIKVEAKELKPNDRLIKFNLPVVSNSNDIELDYAYTHGFFCGDGSHGSGGHPEIDLYHEKRELLPYLEVRNKVYGGRSNDGQWRIEREEVAVYDDAKQQRIVCKLPFDIKPKFFVPVNGYTVESRLAWLAGLMDADGAVARNGSNESLQLSSVNKQFLLDVRLMLQTLGVDSKVVDGYKAGYRSMPDGKGGLKDYYCNATYRLLISSSGLYQLGTLGFVTNRLKWTVRKPQRNAEQFIKVASVEETGRISDTYCFTEHKRNMGMFNGILTGQCVESFSNVKAGKLAHCCNLVSLNLANISDYELPSVCSVAVRLLDNSIEMTTPPFEEAKSHNERYRTIGVGAMGLADWLAKRKLLYSDMTKPERETLNIVSTLFEDIAYWCTRESMVLAKERGYYPAYENSEWHQGKLLGSKHLADISSRASNPIRWAELATDIKKYGIRNSHIMAIAPNTSSSLVQGCTASILPTYSRFHVDKWSNGLVPVAPPFLEEAFHYYQENKQVDQQNIVRMTSTIQFWVDTGISMELVFNPNTDAYGEGRTLTPKDMYEVYLNAWRLGCKAIYYVRVIQKDTLEEEIQLPKKECSVCAN